MMNKCLKCNVSEKAWCWLQDIGHCDWISQDHWKNHNLARSTIGPNLNLEEKPPSLIQQAVSAAVAVTNFVTAGFPVVSDAQKEQRMSICRSCQHYEVETNRCRACGCFLTVKVSMATEECPIKKWVAVAANKEQTGSCGDCNSS